MGADANPRLVRLWAHLTRLQQGALASIEAALKKANMPPLAWYDALLELERAGDPGLRPFELERAMLLAQYSLSRLIDRMEKPGFVVRRPCEADARGQVLAITDLGKQLRRAMWPVYQEAIQRALGDRMSPSQAKNLDALLSALPR